MAYFTDSSGTTLSTQERTDEAKRILRRIESCSGWEDCMTEQASSFVIDKLRQLEMFDSVGEVSLKQLWWLRDLSEKID